jgi:3-hydroxybutyryl-CoA dehydratase
MTDRNSIQPGDSITWERTFSEEDVRTFGELSGDQGVHHLRPDKRGRLMVQGLLTATLPTKIGGDLSFIANELSFQFHLPVYAGDTITCEVRLDEVEPGERWTRLTCSFICTNQDGEVVMTGNGQGVIRNPHS